jgi:hypothetical protein
LPAIATAGQTRRDPRMQRDRWTGLAVVIVVVALALLLVCVEVLGGPSSMHQGPRTGIYSLGSSPKTASLGRGIT